jgi:transposase
MTMPPDDAMTKAYPVHRLEVFTGGGRRRSWTDEEKAQIVAESYGGAETVSAVARRYGLASTQLFTWRREARAPLPEAGVMFAPVKLIDPPPEPAEAAKASAVRHKAKRNKAGGIELEIDGVAIRVERGAEARTVAAIIRALKADR